MRGTHKPPPYAEGPLDAKIMLVGQNPGREEYKTGRPFVGRAGRYLDKVLEKVGLDRRGIYITPLVKEPTPGNRKPTAEEIRRWIPVLEQEITTVRPEIVVLMGRVAWNAPRREGVAYVETYHPAAAMRFPDVRKKFERDMADLRSSL